MFEWVASPEAWVALATLAALEIVLGIDNIIFISILVGRLPEDRRESARFIGLALAMITRLALLFSIVWIMGLVEPWFSVFGHEISGRDVILVGGGLFLLFKATHEIHQSLEGLEGSGNTHVVSSFGMVLVQIAILDIVFSLDSVITAVGLVDQISIMAVAIILAVIVMLVAARPIGDFVDRHPTVKMLALSFLILVGFTLILEGFEVHVPKGYIYFAMAFSVAVEMLNLRLRKKRAEPVELHKPYTEEAVEGAPPGDR
ncbi:TerC family protein [Microbulbifer yueqingensis]|uniref:Membrane protein TerC, possibly involved in tellurium resistance n=1 Tax=Microbulbifer yueqingensis TaxID=658219 RepID=A0A1G9DHP4_9GAMM|nr:TerC family protein [Microbulbifer yueqingensis]SDK63378.1 Membrane protein TerC, possibly involved in tellurium resistance [Microbulbifer yueqingensis]